MNFPIFEAIMMICFGMAWPAAILTSIRSKTSKGKSLPFMIIVVIGYAAGLIHKLWWQSTVDAVVWLYIINEVMVLIDVGLYFRNLGYDRRAERHPTSN